MPYLATLFDQATETSMRETANKIASGAAFVPQENAFAVPILGSMHGHSREDVASVTALAPAAQLRFLRWEVQSNELRIAIELDAKMTSWIEDLQVAFPRCRPWGTRFVSLGSVKGIEPERREDFLSAVSAAFPIDPNILFTTNGWELRESPIAAPRSHRDNVRETNTMTDIPSISRRNKKRKTKPPPISKKPQAAASRQRKPKARPIVPAKRVVCMDVAPAIKKKQRRPRKGVPNQRPPPATRSTLDELIKSGGRPCAPHQAINEHGTMLDGRLPHPTACHW